MRYANREIIGGEILSSGMRNRIYKAMLLRIKDVNVSWIGLCHILFDTSLWDFNEIYPSEMYYYPELDRHREMDRKKVDHFQGYWFPLDEEGRELRIKILKEAIKDTEQP